MRALQSFFAAIVIFTRIPVAWTLPDAAFSRASLQLPLLGWMIGGLQYAILTLTADWLPHDLALFFALVFPCLLSAGLHEDGLADFADGVLGGHSVTRRLEIMKDPRVGSYGVLALLLVFGCSFLALRNTMAARQGQLLLISSVLSRSLCVPLLGMLPYINQVGSRSQGFIPQDFHGWRILLPLWPLLPLFVLMPTVSAQIGFSLLSILLLFFLKSYLQKKLEGLTGDCLGATIKIVEAACFLLGCILWRSLASPP